MVTITKTKKEMDKATWEIWTTYSLKKDRSHGNIFSVSNQPGMKRFSLIMLDRKDDTLQENVVKLYEFIKNHPSRHHGLSQNIATLLFDTLDIKIPQKKRVNKVLCMLSTSDSYERISFAEAMTELDQKVAELQSNLTDAASISPM